MVPFHPKDFNGDVFTKSHETSSDAIFMDLINVASVNITDGCLRGMKADNLN